MALFLLLRQVLPISLDGLGLVPPLLADNLGHLGIGKTWILGRNRRLVMLTVQNKC
jgi:hypothetical protein